MKFYNWLYGWMISNFFLLWWMIKGQRWNTWYILGRNILWLLEIIHCLKVYSFFTIELLWDVIANDVDTFDKCLLVTSSQVTWFNCYCPSHLLKSLITFSLFLNHSEHINKLKKKKNNWFFVFLHFISLLILLELETWAVG